MAEIEDTVYHEFGFGYYQKSSTNNRAKRFVAQYTLNSLGTFIKVAVF